MQDANKRQVGGNHYASTYQHWDMVADSMGAPYFWGCITKYAVRWHKKDGVRDVEKSIHFCDKLIQLHSQLRVAWPAGPRSLGPLNTFTEENHPTALVHAIIIATLTYVSMPELARLRGLLEELLGQAKLYEAQRREESPSHGPENAGGRD